MIKKVLPLIALLSILACGQKDKKANDEFTIVCTTNILGDLVEELVGDQVAVISLMGAGVDPHLYKATQGDLVQLNRADVIVYNGLHLEGKMTEIFEKLSKRKRILSAAEGIQESHLINNSDFKGAYDPHLWFDIEMWSLAAEHLSKELMAIENIDNQKLIQKKQAYLNELKALNQWVKTSISSIPQNQRVLITAHDAFAYFGRAYGIEVRGLQGISTVSEYGLRDVSNLVKFITNRKIKAVFVESSVSARSIEAVVKGCEARGHDVRIGGTLYSDAMGEKGSDAGTYIGMVKHNVNTIVENLK
jgi:manganese/zinc/iron transport system substrate-binding protein